MKYVACCSFGKDSIATILLAHINKEPLDEIVYTEVMFDEETSGDNPEQIKWIYEYAKPKIEELGYPVRVLRAKENYTTLFERVLTRSKLQERIGKIYGFPLSMACYMNSYCKVKPIKEYLKNQECIQYVGIAIDEKKRLENMHKRSPSQVSLLEKYNYTEAMAMELCKKYDLVSPLYKNSTRGGCWFCPNASRKELCQTIKNHPELWNKLTDIYQRNTERLLRHEFSWKKPFVELTEDIKKEIEEKENQPTLL